MTDDGWIKLHRSILDWEHFDNSNAFKLWIYLLLTANHEDKRWNGRLIKAGQKLTSDRHLADQLRLSCNTVREILKRLQDSGEIKIDADKRKGTLITIIKYKDYQNNVSTNVSESVSKIETQTNTQNNTQIDTKQELKNERILTTTIDTRAESEKITEAVQDLSWVESVCMSNQIDMVEFMKMIEVFRLEMSAQNKFHDSVRDIQYHIHSFIRKYREIKKDKELKQSNNEINYRHYTEDPSERLNRILTQGVGNED